MNSALRSHRRVSVTVTLTIVALGTLAGILVRLPFLDMLSHDIIGHLGQWYDYIVLNGGVYALGDRFADYTPAYLYLLTAAAYVREVVLPVITKVAAIKLPSVAADFVMAVAAYNIARLVTRRTNAYAPAIAFVVILLLPTVVINSAVWGQADGIYGAAVLWCVYFLCAKRPAAAMAVFGVAVALKFQSLFIAPLFLVLIIRRQLSVKHVLVTVLVYVLLALPAILLGRAPIEVFGAYLLQSDLYHSLSLGAPNFYIFAPADFYQRGVVAGILAGVVAGLMIAVIFVLRRRETDADEVLACVLVCAMVMPFVLPKMHERYFYLADVLSVLAAIRWRRLLWLPVAYQFISLSAYASVLQALDGWNRYLPDVKTFTWLNALAIAIVVPAMTLWRGIDVPVRRRAGYVLGGGAGIMAVIAAAALVIPGAHHPQNQAAATGSVLQPATDVSVVYTQLVPDGGAISDPVIELVGYRLPSPRTFRTGIMAIDLYFKPLRPFTKAYRLRIDAFALDGRSLELFNEGPVDQAPLDTWVPGEIYLQSRFVTIWPTVAAPQMATFKVSWIDPQTGTALPVRCENQTCDSKVGELPIGLDYATAAPWLQAPSLDTFGAGQELELLNVETVSTQSAGQSAAVTTTWRLAPGLQRLPDLTFFVHMISPDGAMVAQVDAQPRGGAYPTRAWHPGEVVIDVAYVQIPTASPTGQYSLQLGVYRSDTQARLPVHATRSASNPAAWLPDAVVVLGEIKVQR